ncbi:MAG: hypothetical protein KAJ24_04470, partial [Candidatus Aenigmarchaeota archaeon]|nr:hypothetical protein [Candidatus Aenigmarchaeota archaeon]
MKNKRRTLTLLALIFALSVFMKYTIIYSQVPEGAIVDWGDEWSFLSQIEIIKMTYKLPAEDLFFGGIPYVYPPLSLMIYALLYMIIPIGYVSLANNVMPVVGSLAVFSIFYLTYSMTKNETMGILAAYLSLFAPRYMALSSVPIPEMLAHILAPIFILTVWKMADTKDKNYALLAGIAGASIILTHHLTTAVVFIPVFLYIFLLSVIRRNPVYVKLLVIMCATAFLMSSPWWIDTINKDIMNLIVREQEQSIPPLEHYLQQLGPQVFILGIPAILAFAVYGTWKRDERILLIFSWGFVSLFATQSRAFVGTVLGLDSHSNLYLILAPIYGERYFDYMAQPFAIMIAVVLVSAIYYLSSPLKGFLKKKTGDDRVFGHVKIKTAICLFIMVP